ncbi:MAG: hypothetical protein J7484_01155 [Microbacterium sp.]|nr:hypothetical protein [Microbacterium sp.]
MEPHAFFCDRTAAVLWGLPLGHGDDLDVAVAAPHRAPRRGGIRGRQVMPELVMLRELDGFRLTSPASTWAMLGARLSVRSLVRVGDAIVRVPRERGGHRRDDLQLASLARLEAAIAVGRRPGVARLREAIEMVRVGSASPLETDFRLDAAADGLPEPELDIEIRDARGVLLGVTEIGYREYRVLVEIEGDHHRTSKEQWNRDIEKYAAYVAQGFEVVRLTGAHIRGPRPTATARVREALVRHGWRLGGS